MHANACANFDLPAQIYNTEGQEAPLWASPVLSPEAMGPLDCASRPPPGWLPLRGCSSSGARGALSWLLASPLLSSKTQVSSWSPRSRSESPGHSPGAPRTTPSRRGRLLQLTQCLTLPTPADLLALSSPPLLACPPECLGPVSFFLSPCILAAPAGLCSVLLLRLLPTLAKPRRATWTELVVPRKTCPLRSVTVALFGKRGACR